MKECVFHYYTNWSKLCQLDGSVCPEDNENCKDFRGIECKK
jgi:hypothetical protein